MGVEMLVPRHQVRKISRALSYILRLPFKSFWQFAQNLSSRGKEKKTKPNESRNGQIAHSSSHQEVAALSDPHYKQFPVAGVAVYVLAKALTAFRLPTMGNSKQAFETHSSR